VLFENRATPVPPLPRLDMNTAEKIPDIIDVFPFFSTFVRCYTTGCLIVATHYSKTGIEQLQKVF